MKLLDTIQGMIQDILGGTTTSFIGEGNTIEEALDDANRQAEEAGYHHKPEYYEVWCDNCNAFVQHGTKCPNR